MGVESMAKTPYLKRRGGVYYLRLRVPKDVQEAFGRKTIRESLRLTDRREARAEAARRIAGLEEQFQRLRTGDGAPPASLTRRDAARMVGDWELQESQRISTEPVLTPEVTGLSQAEIDDEKLATADMLRELQLAGGEASDNAVERLLHAILLDNGFAQLPNEVGRGIRPSAAQRADVETISAEYAYLKGRVAEALKTTWRATLAKQQGQSRIEAALNPTQPSQSPEEQTNLGELLEQFLRQKRQEQYGARKLHAYNVVSEIMREVFGTDKSIANITNAECRRLVEVLRNIPIHPVLLQLGFADFMERQGARRGERLFPELKLCSRGYYSSSYQKWFTRQLVEAGVKRPRISFHSFRHSFRNAARLGEVPVGPTCRLGGWKLDGIHERYGSYPLDMLKREIEKIDYGLNISRLVAELN